MPVYNIIYNENGGVWYHSITLTLYLTICEKWNQYIVPLSAGWYCLGDE